MTSPPIIRNMNRLANSPELPTRARLQIQEALRTIKEMQETLKLADAFVDDVMPQIGGLVIQNYGDLNTLCMNLTKYRKENE